MRNSWFIPMMIAAVLACGDDSTTSSNGDGETSNGDGDGDNGDGDGDGESNSGDGDGDSGDGDGEPGDGDGEPGDGDGESGDGDGDGDGESGDGDGESGDGDGESGDGDGDGECDPNAFIGEALAENPWGEGDLCDEIWVCATPNQVQALMNLLDVQCDPQGCDQGEQRCTLSYGTIVNPQDIENACTAMTVPGIDEVYCVVYGP